MSKATVYWRFCYLLGTLYYLSSARTRLPSRSENLCDPEIVDDVIASMVPFLVGALAAPEPGAERRRSK